MSSECAPTEAVRVTLPRWGSRRHAELFAEQQRHWIERQKAQLRTTTEAPPPPTHRKPSRNFGARPRASFPGTCIALRQHHGLTVSRVSVRNQRSRWGSCSPSGHICLNWRLVLMPDAVRDYVLIHELMHLRRLDHSRHFWRLVAHACPDYQRARQWLRENRYLLHDS